MFESEDKERRKPLPDSGFYLPVIFSQSSHNYPNRLTKLFGLGWAIRPGGAANGEKIIQTFPPLAPIYNRKFTGSVWTRRDF